MKVKRNPLVFHHVISTKVIGNPNSWEEAATSLRNAIVQSDLYATGPIMYQSRLIEDNTELVEFTLYIPVNSPLNMEGNDKYTYIEKFVIEDGLYMRHADMEEDISTTYDLIKVVAKGNNVELVEPFYNIYLPVFGGGIIDVYAKIKPLIQEENHD